MTPEPCPLFDAFVSDHPEYAHSRLPARLPDGSSELCVPVDVVHAFLNWCLLNGHGDAQKVVTFLAELVPQLRAMERDLEGAVPPTDDGECDGE